MIWQGKPYRWRKRFALIPIYLADTHQWIWLQWVWKRPFGEYTQVRTETPDDAG